MQQEPFDFTAPEDEEENALAVAAATGRQEALGASQVALQPWSEDQLLELATWMPAMRTIRDQPRELGQRRSAILKRLLLNHEHCNTQWVQRDLSGGVHSGKLGLGPTLLARAYGGSEHGDVAGLPPGPHRKLSLELTAKRVTLAASGAWNDFLRLYERDLLLHTVDAHGDGTSAMQPSTAQQADTASASRKTDSCSIRAALQIKQAAIRFKPPLAKLIKRMARRASLDQV